MRELVEDWAEGSLRERERPFMFRCGRWGAAAEEEAGGGIGRQSGSGSGSVVAGETAERVEVAEARVQAEAAVEEEASLKGEEREGVWILRAVGGPRLRSWVVRRTCGGGEAFIIVYVAGQ